LGNDTLQTNIDDGNQGIFNVTTAEKIEIQPVFDQIPDEKISVAKPELELETEQPIELTNQVTNESIIGPEAGTETKIFEFENNYQNMSVGEFAETGPTPSVEPMSLSSSSGDNIKRIRIGDFRIFKNSLVCAPAQNTSCNFGTPVEPVTANVGRDVFFAGNVFAARSNDAGNTWQYINPANHGRLFCCDQDVIYSARYGVFIWYLQGGFPQPPSMPGPGYSTVAVSRDLINWWYYNIPTTLFGSERASQWTDFPHIALSDNNFYLTTHFKRQMGGGPFLGMLISRWDLNAMSNAQPVTILYIVNPEAGVAPVQGATNIMYFGTNNVCEPGVSPCAHSNHLLKVLRWHESSSDVESTVINIPPWQPTLGTAIPDCPTPGSTVQFCTIIKRVGPNAVSGGWVLGGVVGFVWNSHQGSDFPHMYIYGAVLNANDLSYNHKLLMWNPEGAFMQAHVAPSRGRLALAAYFGDSTRHPTVCAGLFTNTDTVVPYCGPVMNGQASAELGDYLRVRPYSGTGVFQNSGPLWVGSGYTQMQNPDGSTYNQPFYFIFGIEGRAGNPFMR
jgi:hypothetical protein